MKDDALSGTVNLSWTPRKDVLFYASYSRGNKSGGLNLTVLPAGVEPEVEPETVDAYETGIKSQWLGRRLTTNLALFQTTVDDYQTSIVEQDPEIGVTYTYINNIGKVRSRGAEADLRLVLPSGLTTGVSAAYTDGQYEDYANAPCPLERASTVKICDISGASLPGISKYAGNVYVDMIRQAGPAYVYGRVDYAYRSSYNTTVNISRYAEVDAYGLVNVRIGVQAADQQWDVSLWARNLLDEDYFQTLSTTDFGLVTGRPGDPRTVGVTAKWRF